jgi:drug/metabolite transporter (DMT)-like permease
MPGLASWRGRSVDPVAVSGLNSSTFVAFVATAILAGGNAVAVKAGLAELAPFWGAALRFLASSAILLGAAAVLRLARPNGRALAGALIYGILNFGLSFTFLYWALQEVTAATGMMTLATVPLLTLILAALQGVERFNLRGLLGALLAAVGIAVVFGDKIGSVSPLSLGALIAGALAMAEVPIVVKKFPRVHPVVENAIGMAAGGGLLLVLSLMAAEPRVLPTTPGVQISLIYLVLLGSIGLFLLFLFVLRRWTASATSYVMLLAPFSAVVLGWLFLGEAPSSLLLVGGAIAIFGVYIGAVAPSAGAKSGSSTRLGN